MLPFYRRPIKLKTVLLVLLLPLVATGVPALLWLGWNARPLNIAREFDIETPAVPTPNAYDIFEKAATSFSEQKVPKPPALILDTRAAPDAVDDPKKYPQAGKIRWVQQNRANFQLFNEGLKTPYLFPPVRSGQVYGNVSEPYWLTWLAKDIVVECEVLAAQGHSDKAVDRAFDIWQIGLGAVQGAPLLVSLQATKLEMYPRQVLDKEIAHLNGPQAKAAAGRLEALLSKRVPYEEILREERNVGLFQIKPLYEQAIHEKMVDAEIEAAFARGETDVTSSGASPAELRGPIINWVVRRKANEYDRGMKLLIANANSPWSRRQVALPANLEPKMAKLMGVLDNSRFYFARPQTSGNLTLARLALHAYRKDKGVYPPTLESLIPKYLAKTPVDPFADNQPLRYTPSGKRYKLWSIGPDGRDDNARPALNPKSTKPSSKYLVTMDATGDFVALISR